MRKNLYAMLLVLAVVAMYAMAQSTNPPSNRPPWSEQPNVVQDQHSTSSKHEAASDREDIQRLVQQQLQSDPALSNVTAETSEKDVVTLTGTVASRNDREHAKQLAESVPGVRKVKDKIKVAGEGANAGPRAEENDPDRGTAPGNPNSPAGKPNDPTHPSANPMPPHR